MENLNQFVPWIAVGLVVAGMIALWVRKPPVSAAEALAEVQEATEITRQFVAAAEQLWQTGRLARDSRFDYVVARLAERYPGMDTTRGAGGAHQFLGDGGRRWLGDDHDHLGFGIPGQQIQRLARRDRADRLGQVAPARTSAWLTPPPS